MAVPIIQSIIGVVLVLLGIDTAKNPPTTAKMLWLYRTIFSVLGVLFLSLSWIQYRNEQIKAAAALERIQTLTIHQVTAQTISHPEPMPAGLSSNQIDFARKYQTLLDELAANKSLDPNLRERMIIARAKIGKDDSADIPVPPEKTVAAPPPPSTSREVILPYFDEAVKTLASASEMQARIRGDTSVLNYQGLPQDLPMEAKAGKRFRKNVGQVFFQKNTAWEFKIEFVEMVKPKYEADLSITCGGGFLLLKSVGDRIETRVETLKGESFEHPSVSGEEAKANIADAMNKLVAAEVDVVIPKR